MKISSNGLDIGVWSLEIHIWELPAYEGELKSWAWMDRSRRKDIGSEMRRDSPQEKDAKEEKLRMGGKRSRKKLWQYLGKNLGEERTL